MDEICSALEDAKLISAIHDNDDTKANWQLPSLAKVEVFKESLKRDNPDILTAEGLCQQPLGLYLVLNHIP
jgi:hypothetical protein